MTLIRIPAIIVVDVNDDEPTQDDIDKVIAPAIVKNMTELFQFSENPVYYDDDTDTYYDIEEIKLP